MGSRNVLTGLMAAGLMAAALGLALVPATGTSAGVRQAPAASGSSAASGLPEASGQPPASGLPDAGGLPLAGQVVGIDPGHNGLNDTSPAFLDRRIWNGRGWERCDSAGTRTAGGYAEASFTWNVAVYLRADLIRMGARVVMTRTDNDGVGPCADARAHILDQAHADVSIDIHADGGPRTGRGFTVLEPVADGPNNRVIGPSLRFGRDVRAMMLRDTPVPVSDYYGRDGYISRDDLAGLNLTTMPKVLIESGNMSNAADAALLVRPGVQQAIAQALGTAIARFLAGR